MPEDQQASNGGEPADLDRTLDDLVALEKQLYSQSVTEKMKAESEEDFKNFVLKRMALTNQIAQLRTDRFREIRSKLTDQVSALAQSTAKLSASLNRLDSAADWVAGISSILEAGAKIAKVVA